MRRPLLAALTAALVACSTGSPAGGSCETPTRLESTVCADGLVCIASQASGGQNPGRCWADCSAAACPGGCTCGTTDVVAADGGVRQSAPHCLASAGTADARCHSAP